MKTSLTKSKNSLLLFAILVAAPVWAKPVAQVTEVKGQVFVITPEGKTRSANLNDHLEDRSELMVEEGGSITVNDYFDATYHVIGGGHLKLFTKSVQLKRGKTWVQAKNPKHTLALTTANGQVDFSKCEFIATFDQSNSRSQILVVNGDAEVSNVLDRQTKFPVPAGTFTLIDPDVENGVPRAPTKVGIASLNTALAEFKRLPDTMKDAKAPAVERKIASVEEVPAPAAKKGGPQAPKGEIIFITTNRLPASVGGAHQYWMKNAKKKTSASHSLTTAPIKFFGMASAAPAAVRQEPVPRSPASVPMPVKAPQKAIEKVNLDTEFGDTLKTQSEQQPKYSKELESLIKDLKSY